MCSPPCHVRNWGASSTPTTHHLHFPRQIEKKGHRLTKGTLLEETQEEGPKSLAKTVPFTKETFSCPRAFHAHPGSSTTLRAWTWGPRFWPCVSLASFDSTATASTASQSSRYFPTGRCSGTNSTTYHFSTRLSFLIGLRPKHLY